MADRSTGVASSHGDGEGPGRRARTLGVVSLAVLALIAAMLPVADAGASNGVPLRMVQSAAVAPSGATALGAQSASTAQTGMVVLRPRDDSAVQSFIASVTNPRSASFHHYLARGAYASRFGPSSSTIAAVRSQLTSDGLTVSSVSSDGLVIRFSGSTAQVNSAFHTTIERYRLANGTTGTGTTSAVQLPASIAGSVSSVVGLDNLVHAQPRAIHASGSANAKFPAAKTADFTHPTGSPTACSDATADAQEFGGLTDDQIADSYGAFGLYGAGDTGAGAHVGIYELEPFDPTDLQTFDQCFFGNSEASQMAGRVNVVPVDGGQPSGSGSGESILDVEDVSAMAPGANIDVYEAPNTRPSVELLDVYTQIDQRRYGPDHHLQLGLLRAGPPDRLARLPAGRELPLPGGRRTGPDGPERVRGHRRRQLQRGPQPGAAERSEPVVGRRSGEPAVRARGRRHDDPERI